MCGVSRCPARRSSTGIEGQTVAAPLRVGLVGTGFGTRVHLPGYVLSGAVDVVGICSAQLSRAQSAAEQFGVTYATDQFQQLIDRENVDLIDISTPPRSHRQIALAALDAGKHVLCEKPLALDAFEAVEMLERGRSAGVVHAVNNRMRYDGVRRHLQRLVAEGYLGRPQFVVLAVHANHGTDPSHEPYY